MIAATAWRKVVDRARGATPGQYDGLRGVATRLAAQTVVLLLVMLVALEAVVYLITQQTLVGALETTLQARASQADPEVCGVFHLQCFGNGAANPNSRGNNSGRGTPPGGGGFQRSGGGSNSGPGGFRPVVGPSEASAAYIDPSLHIVHSDGALANIVLSPADVRTVIRTGVHLCCTVKSYKEQDYLVYTAPLLADGKAVGAVQTSISEHQYEDTRQSLVQALFLVALLGLLTSGGVSLVLVGRALRPIRRAVQRQRDFVADAAHELRTPLAIQRTVGEVGMSEPSADELQSTVAQMLSENQHLTRLVEDLSLLARTDTNAVFIDRRPVDITSLVTDTGAEIGFLAESEGVELIVEAQPQVWALGDVVRIRQVLLILLDNAFKHTPNEGRVILRAERVGETVRLLVHDSGTGIDPLDLPRVFDRFYRADRARTGEGSGLGLAIAKWVAEAHGGHIAASNAPTGGAVFTVTLPATQPASGS